MTEGWNQEALCKVNGVAGSWWGAEGRQWRSEIKYSEKTRSPWLAFWWWRSGQDQHILTPTVVVFIVSTFLYCEDYDEGENPSKETRRLCFVLFRTPWVWSSSPNSTTTPLFVAGPFYWFSIFNLKFSIKSTKSGKLLSLALCLLAARFVNCSSWMDARLSLALVPSLVILQTKWNLTPTSIMKNIIMMR